jgi:hypothetical protein
MRVGGGTLAKLQQQTTTATTANPDRLSFSVEKAATEVCHSQLEQVLRKGAIRLLIDALEREIVDFIQEHREVRDSEGRQAVVRNGHTRARTIQTAFLKDRVARRRQMALPARRAKDSRVSGMPTYRESWNSSGTQQECHWASRSSEGLRTAG